MSSMDSILSSLAYEVDQLTRDMNRKANLGSSQWTGAARSQYDKSHEELSSNANQVRGDIDNLKRAVRALESSIQDAERDMAYRATLRDNK